MNSELKSASSVKTGKNFSAKRIELGYSIDEACKKVFINKDYLICLLYTSPSPRDVEEWGFGGWGW